MLKLELTPEQMLFLQGRSNHWPDDAQTDEGIFVVNKKELNRLSTFTI